MNKKFYVLGILCLHFSLLLFSSLAAESGMTDRKNMMLSGNYSESDLDAFLITADKWHPAPTWSERVEWATVPETFRKTTIERAEGYLNYGWPALPATVFLEFDRNGNRENFQKLNFSRRYPLRDLVLAECLEGKKRFLDDIVNGIWCICEETYWGLPAHLNIQTAGYGLPDITEPTVDLFAAETGALLAWTYYLLGEQLDSVSPLVRPRIEYEIQHRILTPCLERTDFWWMGFERSVINNWTPWCNSNWLTCVLFMDKDRSSQLAAITKIMRSLDIFIDSYPDDGGCDEGPGYWSRAGASLFECLDMLDQCTRGHVVLWDEPLIQKMGQYIYKAHVAGNYFLNFADAPLHVSPPAVIVFSYGQRIKDPALMAFGAALYEKNGLGIDLDTPAGSIARFISTFFLSREVQKADKEFPYLRDVLLPETQIFSARRQGGGTTGLFVAAKGGHNAESHNHNDVGHFVVYLNGLPMMVDAGVGVYTRKTFSDRRYEIWTMQSAYHNLPTINGIQQKAGSEYRARNWSASFTDEAAILSLDIAGAYPPEAQVKTWQRQLNFKRQEKLAWTDEFELNAESNDIELSVLTSCRTKIDGNSIVLTHRDSPKQILVLKFETDKLSVKVESITIEDAKLTKNWPHGLSRIVFSAITPKTGDQWNFSVYEK